MITAIENVFLWFMIYSVCGWIYETIICSIEARHLVERGFLNGPYCPIYGCGALIDILTIGRIESPVLLFFLGMILTTTLEYITSYVMEKLFHARWWDYSDYRFNIAGRVCLIGAVVFGLFSLVLVKVIHPAVMGLTALLPELALHITAGVLFAAFVADIAVTLAGFAGFNDKLKALTAELDAARDRATELLRSVYEREGERFKDIASGIEAAKDKVAERLQNSALGEAVSSAVESFSKKLSGQQARMIRSFPKLKSVNYNGALSELREFIEKSRREKKDKRDKK